MPSLRLVDEDGDVLMKLDPVEASAIAHHIEKNPCTMLVCGELAVALVRWTIAQSR